MPWKRSSQLSYSPSVMRQTFGFSHRAGKMEYILSGCSFPGRKGFGVNNRESIAYV